MDFCWTTLQVRDMEASLRFYQEIVGLPLARRMKTPEGLELAFLGSGATQVELICSHTDRPVTFGPDISLGFRTTSLEQVVEVLKAHGLSVHSGPFQPNPSIRFLYALDPDGLKVQFVESLA